MYCARPGRGEAFERGIRSPRKDRYTSGRSLTRRKTAQGYFVFDPDTQSISSPDPADIPETRSSPDSRMRPEHIIVDFGDSYFLDTLIRGIGYNEVLDCIPYSNRDTLKSMIAFYTLEDKPNSYAETWFSGNYASFLYPRANLASQRPSEFMAYIGRPEGRMLYIVKIPAVVGHDADGRDVTGYIFLCRDIEKYEAMCRALTRAEKAATRTSAEKKSFGLFAIITTGDVTPEGILPEYYVRQGIEQFFDFAKNYAKLLLLSKISVMLFIGIGLLFADDFSG